MKKFFFNFEYVDSYIDFFIGVIIFVFLNKDIGKVIFGMIGINL